MRSLAILCLMVITASCDHEDDRPWVFRSVLDDLPRMVTVELGNGLNVAYDAERAFLYKAWNGSVELEGAVYTTVHGPQPRSTGAEYFRSDARQPWVVFKDDLKIEPLVQYAGIDLIPEMSFS